MTEQSNQREATVAVLTRDLFFGMRIRNALRQLGYVTLLKKSEAEFAEAMDAPECALGFVDFNAEVDWDTIGKIVEAQPDIAVIAFGPHTDTDAFRQARETGVTRVVSNGAFSKQLADLVERYTKRS